MPSLPVYTEQNVSRKLRAHQTEENLVETIWLQLTSLLSGFYGMAKGFPVVKRLFEFLAKFQLFNFPKLKKYDTFSHFI